ncbi:hypothetical protein BDF19DRAFT_446679 [Syncephalis fuscata]|nr:hypothetical protein BDF19DRAFT_446679 [Syncephalis fuscata]
MFKLTTSIARTVYRRSLQRTNRTTTAIVCAFQTCSKQTTAVHRNDTIRHEPIVINGYERRWAEKNAPSLSDFILRAQIRQLYREFQRTIWHSEVAKADREELLGWVRHEFKRSRTGTSQDALKTLLSEGRRQLHNLERSLMLSG